LSSAFVLSVLLILALDHILSCSYYSNSYLYIDEPYWLVLATPVLSFITPEFEHSLSELKLSPSVRHTGLLPY
jgi:hypothetical protein